MDVRTESCVPCVASVAISITSAGLIMYPSPIGIDDNLATLACAFSTRSTALPAHGRVGFCLLRSRLLAASNCGQQRRCERKASIHDE
jgi:hypothetical protein